MTLASLQVAICTFPRVSKTPQNNLIYGPILVSGQIGPGMKGREDWGAASLSQCGVHLRSFFSGALGKAPSKVTDALPEPEPSGAMAASDEEEEEEEALEAMQSRLATLRS